jgi:ADP-ribosyl-[dinitrogen reductase] hydrolase
MTGGGPFHLKAGEWTNDTSVALCLAESLVERNGFDDNDQTDRYCLWHEKATAGFRGYRDFDVQSQVIQYVLSPEGCSSVQSQPRMFPC